MPTKFYKAHLIFNAVFQTALLRQSRGELYSDKGFSAVLRGNEKPAYEGTQEAGIPFGMSVVRSLA
jgi:hypothetical protein